MSSFRKYLHASETVARMRAEREAASERLELALIRERLAEIESQFQPLGSHVQSNEERQRHIDTAFYVVVGRWPKREERPYSDEDYRLAL